MNRNPWIPRVRKFLIAAGVAVVTLANSTIDGPDWLYGLATVIGAGLVYWVGNAPEFKDPRVTKSLRN